MKAAAQVISYVFHPIFMVSYGVVLLYLINPYLFSIPDSKALGVLFIYVFLLSVFFPVLSILLMKSLGFVKSLKMEERTDRVAPLIVTSIFYLWLYINIYSNPGIPEPISIFVLGTVIALFIAFFINNFSKISLHSIGVGGAITGAFFVMLNYSYESFPVAIDALGSYNISIALFLIIVIIIAGLVMSSRLLLSRHKPADIYGGFLVGVFGQIIAFAFIT